MSKGHTIPLLHVARLLHGRGIAVTIVTTPANHPFISHILPHASIAQLPFPGNIPGIPPGIESTDKLPSMSLFVPFVTGIKGMQPSFENLLHGIHSQVCCVISDGFLPWTLQSASLFGIPRVSFYGMSHYAMATTHSASTNRLIWSHESKDEPFAVTDFPWIKLTRDDFPPPFDQKDPGGPFYDFVTEAALSMQNSHGLLMNTFDELEHRFMSYTSHKSRLKFWNIGPLCTVQPRKTEQAHVPNWIQWLDEKLSRGSRVLYVAFGSQVRLMPAQLREIAFGLEESNVCYLWVVKKRELEESNLEGNVSGTGISVDEWVNQTEILEHPAVQGFLSHCGWNSVSEAICAEVPILAWPMMAEQFMNAKMVTEEIKIGMRVKTVDGSSKGFVAGKELKEMVIELMEGAKGKAARKKVRELGAAAKNAMAEGGSSWHGLNDFIVEMQEQHKISSQ